MTSDAEVLRVLLWLLSLLASVVITIIAQEPIQWLVSGLLGGLGVRRRREVTGLWEASYTYGRPDNIKTEMQLVELRQFGSFVSGQNLTGKNHLYRIRGRIEAESFFTGTWRSRKQNNIYHGALQATISPRGDEMKGKWIGFGKDHQINVGNWEWRLITRDISSKAKQQALQSVRKEDEASLVGTQSAEKSKLAEPRA